ncbi:hypothetical protein AAF712_007578 [Marasmius tenuissimus]|uniref:RING-type domain-containing protein n=1 Tax=Marasmius tenuissimus TaxID=585030 RepID=A0ABR2ZX52_9AGAR
MSGEQASASSSKSVIEISSESEGEGDLNGNGTKKEKFVDLASLRHETKRLRSVNCSITRKWTDAESNLKASQKECDRLESARREDAQKHRAEQVNLEFLKKWIVGVESNLVNVQQERDQLINGLANVQQERDLLVNTAQNLQAQSDFLRQQGLAQQQTIHLLDVQRLAAEARGNELSEAMASLQGRSIELSRIEDIVNCGICTNWMFSPWMLTCGHNFCSPCLTTWFTETLDKFKQQYPQYDPRNRTYYHPLTNDDRRQIAQAKLPHEVAAVLVPKTLPKPDYTCPNCCSSVDRPPSQNYALKDLVTAGAEVRHIELPPMMDAATLSRLWYAFWPQSQHITVTV